MEPLPQQQQQQLVGQEGNDNNSSSNSTSMIKHITSITGVHEINRVQLDEADASGCKTYSANKSSASSSNTNNLINVLSARLGARVLFATDEWFATADNLINDTHDPVFDPDAYCAQGKVMDGWESRRRREAGHDWCIIHTTTVTAKGATPSVVSSWSHVDVDTAYFTGNQVPAISIQVAHLDIAEQAQLVQQLPGGIERLLRNGKGIQGMGALPEQVQQAQEACDKFCKWTEILPRTPLQPGYEESRYHSFDISSSQYNDNVLQPPTLVKVNYFPDGGVARLRLWGKLQQQGDVNTSPISSLPPVYMPITTGPRCTVVSHTNVNNEHDDNNRHSQSHVPSRQAYRHPELSSSSQHIGGKGVACSNQHYGTPQNLLQDSLGRDMGDGWETARHPNRPPILVRNPNTNLIDNNLSDWCILKLGQVARHGISRIILDTKHFFGNYPESIKVQGALMYPDEDSDNSSSNDKNKYNNSNVEWFDIIARCRMSPDAEHVFDADLQQLENATRPVSLIRVTIFPDGGLSRVRVYGQPENDGGGSSRVTSTDTTTAIASHL